MILRLLLFVVVVLIIEFYSFQVVKTLTNSRLILLAYSIISGFIIVFIAYQFLVFDRSVGQTRMTMLTLALLLITFLPKILLTKACLKPRSVYGPSLKDAYPFLPSFSR